MFGVFAKGSQHVMFLAKFLNSHLTRPQILRDSREMKGNKFPSNIVETRTESVIIQKRTLLAAKLP